MKPRDTSGSLAARAAPRRGASAAGSPTQPTLCDPFGVMPDFHPAPEVFDLRLRSAIPFGMRSLCSNPLWHGPCLLKLAMKRIRIIAVLAALITVVGTLVFVSNRPKDPGHLDVSKLFRAIQAYADTHPTNGLPLPATVSLDELIHRGLLQEADVSVFRGLDVQINLGADETRPADVLAQARLPDGVEIVALADGSVQPRRR